jgi:hypothetical protein
MDVGGSVCTCIANVKGSGKKWAQIRRRGVASQWYTCVYSGCRRSVGQVQRYSVGRKQERDPKKHTPAASLRAKLSAHDDDWPRSAPWTIKTDRC